MDHADVSTASTPEGPVAPARLSWAGLKQSAMRILLGVEAGLVIIAIAAVFIDPYAPPGCPSSAAMGRDCTRFGYLGRFYSAYLQDRANKAPTPRKTLTEVDQAIALRPNFVFAFNTRGIAYAAMGKPDEALRAFDRALELAPNYVGARANRALLYQQIGRSRDAARDFRAVYMSPPDSHRRAEVVEFAHAVDHTTR